MALQLAGRDPGGLPQRFRGGAVCVGLAGIGGAGVLKCAQADGDDDVDAESARRRDSGDLAVFARCTECDEPGLENPGGQKEANWLPAPSDKFVLMLRLYWPKTESPSILNGTWKPPAVQKAD